MSLIDLIGFVISLLALIFLFFRNTYTSRMSNEEREELERAESELPEEHPLQNFLKALEGEIIEEEEKRVVRAPPPPVVMSNLQTRKLKSSLADYHLTSKLSKYRHEESHINRSSLFQGIDDPKKLVIYYEIMRKPKALEWLERNKKGHRGHQK